MKQLLLVAFLLLAPLSGAEAKDFLGLFGCRTALLNNGNKLRVAIVAGVSSGSAIPPRFKKLGFVESVHVMTKEGFPHGYRLKKDDYIARIPYADDLDKIAAQLKALGVTAVLPGSEMGVEMADALSEKLGLVTNGTKLSIARRNKFIMQEAIKNYFSARYPKGIPGIRQREVKNLEDFRKWHEEENEGQWPVVLKPSESAATDGLNICEDYEQVEKALAASIGKPNLLGRINNSMLAQEYLKAGVEWVNGKLKVIPATEYVVDMVSLGGKRIVTDVWKYHKTLTKRLGGGLSNIYDLDEMLDPESEVANDLIAYAQEVLDALGIQNGASHMEIMMTDRGPVLVEVGARLIGGASHLAVEEATGVNPIEVLYEAYFAPEKFLKRWKDTPHIKKNKHAWMLQLISPRSGQIQSIPGADVIKGLSAFKKLELAVGVGDWAKVTVDLVSSPGQVVLAHEDIEEMKKTRQAIRELEPEGLFEFANWYERALNRVNPLNWIGYWHGLFRR